MTTLVITEKPSVAKKIARAIGGQKAKLKYYVPKVPTYEFSVNGEKILVAPAAGHLYGLTDKKTKSFAQYSFSPEWAPLHEAQKGKNYTKAYIQNFEKLGRQTHKIIVATDYDIEGEVIAYTIIHFSLHRTPETDPHIYRMKFSALTPTDLKKAWQNLSKGMDVPLAHAGVLRHTLDWFWGINLSRAIMNAVEEISGKRITLSIGRVQGATLKLIVEREREIENFKPEPYFTVRLIFRKNGEKYTAEYLKNPVKTFDEAVKIVRETNAQERKVTLIEPKEVKVKPPTPFNLSELQKEAYNLFKFSPKKTLQLAQKLYERSLITYPRTESQKLPEHEDFKRILENLGELKEYRRPVETVLSLKKLKPNNGAKSDPAHPAIHPTGVLPDDSLDEDERKLYDLIVRRFIATFMPPGIFEKTRVIISSGEHQYKLLGSRVMNPSWLTVYPFHPIVEKELPPFNVGEVIQGKANFEKRFTQPPARYNQATLLAKLQSLKIGTKTTRGLIIDTLYRRGYITGRKEIRPTPLGRAVVEVFEKYAPQVVSIELTREFEEKIRLVEEGKTSIEPLIAEAEELLMGILAEINQHKREIGELLISKLREGPPQKAGRKGKKVSKPSRRRRSQGGRYTRRGQSTPRKRSRGG